MIPQRLYAHEVHQATHEVMQRHLGLEAAGYKCDGAMLRNVLLKAATERISNEPRRSKLRRINCG